MGWIYEYAQMRLAADEMSAADWGSIVQLVNQSLPHAEVDIHPQHCQLCRNAIIVTAAVKSGVPFENAVLLLTQVSAEASMLAFMRPEVTRAPTVDEDVTGVPV
jgi:hypothetical protein